MPSKIERLPVELIDLIVLHLSLHDRQALRLASKQLCALTLTTFSNDYFSRRATTLGVPSLDRLAQASAHPYFSSCVTLLDIKLLNYEDYGNLQKIDRVGVYPPPKRFPQVAQVKTEDISQECRLFDYMRTHQDPTAVVYPLTRALRGLRNLKTIRLRVNGLTLNATPYIRDAGEVYQTFLTACFRAVLDAIIRSRIRLREFTCIKGNAVRPLSKSANLSHRAFRFPAPYYASLVKAFSALKSLRLSIITYHNENDNTRGSDWEHGISHFITAASSLEDLSLCLQTTDEQPWNRAAVMHLFCRSVEMPKLISLQLYGCVIDELDLVVLVRKHAPTLRRLRISDTGLGMGTWASVLNVFKDDLKLDYLRLQYLGQSVTPQAVRWNTEDMKNSRRLTIDAGKNRENEYMNRKLLQAISFLTATIERHEIDEI